ALRRLDCLECARPRPWAQFRIQRMEPDFDATSPNESNMGEYLDCGCAIDQAANCPEPPSCKDNFHDRETSRRAPCAGDRFRESRKIGDTRAQLGLLSSVVLPTRYITKPPRNPPPCVRLPRLTPVATVFSIK